MKRRGALVGIASVLGGCSMLSESDDRATPTSVPDKNPPNLFFEYDRVSAGAVEITVVDGNTVRASDGWDVGVTGATGEIVMWVSASDSARQSFPLTVGDSITVDVEPPPDSLRMIYSARDHTESMQVDRYDLETTRTAEADR